MSMPTEPIPAPVLPTPLPQGMRAAYSKHLLDRFLREERASLAKNINITDPLPIRKLVPDELPGGGSKKHFKPCTDRVAIVGAGVAGLYIAMMLKFLDIPHVDIYEASDRVGGRCYTYQFPEDKDCPHNYYDVGAMRIPDIDTMKSTLNLIQNLGLDDKKRSYILDAKCEPTMHWYNKNGDGPDINIFADHIRNIISKLQKDFDKGIDSLLKGNKDDWSTKTWLMILNDLSYDETVEAEAADTSTGLFDMAFLETLCDYCDFQVAKDQPWYRMEGGMSVVTDEMNKHIEDPHWPSQNSPVFKVKTGTPVVAMSEDKTTGKINVTATNRQGLETRTEKYDMVFNTTAMAPLQRMDIEGLDLNKKILTGIRGLSYDRSCKVAIKFKTPWWNRMYPKPEVGIEKTYGGVSSTDLPISNVVYPSWCDGEETSTVLMVSYSWAQDATRMGSLIPKYSKQNPPHVDEPLVTLCLQNLAKLWSEQGPDPPTFEFLREQYITHHAWAWSHDPYTGGAFALFGPGQFKNVYPEFQHLFCEGKFAMCGEALSTHHAWISGALDSAYATVMRWLQYHELTGRISYLKESWFGGGEGEHPEDFDERLVWWSAELSKSNPEIESGEPNGKENGGFKNGHQ
ncbi:L-amino acid oxidase [Fusarium albosuccineum]|uniref:L-amino acid oxidase n=1 Tax=Fusarium albosuccineum TaxID=1237068 RepID=A0A8H4LAP6_9HYPO|nr:L-amino acid oxidase [Fusarium albosuccineum]